MFNLALWARRVPAWIYVSVLLGAVLGGLALVSQPFHHPLARQTQVAILYDSGVAAGTGRTVKLPHVWDDERPALSGEVVYRMRFDGADLRESGQALSLYLPRVGARFRVRLNGLLLQQQEWDTPGYVDTSVRPYLVPLPPDFFIERWSDNVIDVEVRGQVLRKSGLSAVTVGPQDVLGARQDHVLWWQVHVTWMVAACSLMLSILAGLIWLQTHERVFGLLAVASAAWAVRLALTPLVNPHLPFELWFFLHKLSFTVYCGFLYLFFWDLFEFRQGRTRSLVIGLLWLGPLWLAVTTLSGNYDLYRIWAGILAVVSAMALSLMMVRARFGLDPGQRLMVVVGAVTLITGLRDFGVVQLGWPGDADLRWMTPGSLVFMLSLMWVLVQRTASQVQQIGDLNRDLGRRVREKELELREAFERLREAENRRVLEDERRRLTRDMHDGLGSQLVHALNVVRSGAPPDRHMISAMLGHALDELRMTLDSLEPMEGDLPAILGTLRQRISPALEAAGIDLQWEVQEVPALQGLESRGVMHLFRCLQEVFANIIKHARADRVVVCTWSEGGRTMLSVRDNGIGMNGADRQGGRGLGNIRLRAAEIGATVEFLAADPGVLVRFSFAPEKRATGAS